MGGLLTVEGIKHRATLIGIILIVITNAVSRKEGISKLTQSPSRRGEKRG